MDEKSLSQFFKSRLTKVGKRRWGCLDESHIAAYVDHQFVGREKERVEAHLADCNYCLDQVTFVARSRNAALPESVPDALLLRASKLAGTKAKSEGSTLWVWGKIAAASAVACLVLVTAVSLRHPRTIPTIAPLQNPIAQRAPASIAPTVRSERHPAVRGGQKSIFAPTVISPVPGGTIQMDEIEFRWQPVPSALDYEVVVLTPEGDQVWQQRTSKTSIQPPVNASLEAGHKYFVTVRAYLSEGKSAQSAPVAFTVGRR